MHPANQFNMNHSPNILDYKDPNKQLFIELPSQYAFVLPPFSSNGPHIKFLLRKMVMSMQRQRMPLLDAIHLFQDNLKYYKKIYNQAFFKGISQYCPRFFQGFVVLFFAVKQFFICNRKGWMLWSFLLFNRFSPWKWIQAKAGFLWESGWLEQKCFLQIDRQFCSLFTPFFSFGWGLKPGKKVLEDLSFLLVSS